MQPIQAQGYEILFNDDGYIWLAEALKPDSCSKLFILADANTSQHCMPAFLQQMATEVPIEIIEIEAGEANKTIDSCIQVWHVLAELGADRKSIIINLGGGMVTDLGGFVASTFKRGIDFINVPTTLLAMVDASVGGKTGVDLGSLKNQVGVINNPKMVLINPQFLETLPQEEMRSGLAEMLKHGIIADKSYWNNFTDLSGLTTDDLTELIHRSVEIKNDIVQQDPAEKGIRKLLNYGHTLGHAIESYFLENNAKSTLLHGEAIAVGMILEAYAALEKGLLATEQYIEIKTVISSIFERVDFSDEDIAQIIKLLAHDKKNEFGAVNFTLPEGIGKGRINQPVENELIFRAFDNYNK